LYKMSDRKDWEKYRTLSDADIQEELNKSREIKENMYTMSGVLKNGKYGSKGSSRIKLVAPQLGTQSRARKIENKNWEADLKAMTSGGDSSNMRTSSEFHNTMRNLVDNSGPAVPEPKVVSRPSPPQFRRPTGGFDVSQSAEDRIAAAVETMKQKYEQNLHVVEKLFDEKQLMDRKIKLLERRLSQQEGRDESGYAETGNRGGPEDDDNELDFLDADPRLYATYNAAAPSSVRDSAGGMRLKQSSYEPDMHRPNSKQQQQVTANRTPQRSAQGHEGGGEDEYGGLFGDDEDDDGAARYSAGDMVGLLNRGGGSGAGGRGASSTDRARPASADHRARHLRASTGGGGGGRDRALRSSSAGTHRGGVRASTGTGFGSTGGAANLQADADRLGQT
jgi:hypothetical protein